MPRWCCLLIVCAGLLPAQILESKVDPWVERQLRAHGSAEVIIVLEAQADLEPARRLTEKADKGRFVFEALRAVAQATQPPILELLAAQGAEHRPFLIVNAIWAKVTEPLVRELVARLDVRHLEGNPITRGLLSGPDAKLLESPATFAVEPGIAFTNAPQVWALGFTGQGVVVGGQDTGYQWDHPALRSQYRGWNGTSANHNLHWHDSIHSGGGSCGADNLAPCDDNAHGTHTMGTVLGDDGAGNQIGMAPTAQWIGVRNMDQGNGTPATYLESFEWFLAPYPLGGSPMQGNPALAPDLTTNSWACPPSEGCSALTLQMACAVHRLAGILPVVAAGNSGSNCSTVADPPAIYDECFTVGAHRHDNGSLAGFSSRGPVTVDSSGRVKPDIAAPGVNVRSCVPGNSYAGGWNGTSMATPHVAGVVALLISAHPALRGQVDAIEQVINDTATEVAPGSCGGTLDFNNHFGHGRVDALAAVMAVRQVSVSPVSPSTTAAAGQIAVLSVSVSNDGYLSDTFALSATPGAWSAQVSPTSVVVGAGQAAVVSVLVTIPPGASLGQMDSVTLTATSQNFAAASATTSAMTVTVVPLAPLIVPQQPTGPGSPLEISLLDLVPGHEYFFVISPELCPGAIGSGPYLGLCSSNEPFLIAQISLPLGTPPFHFLASASSELFGPYPLAPGVAFDAVAFDLTGGLLLGFSPVARIVIQ